MYDPSRDETFAGAIDGPSLRNGEPIRVGDKELLEDLVVTLAVGGRGIVRKRREALKSIRAHRSMGSSALTLSYVACGRFDVYAQGAGLSAWDVAAAGLIAERAGATVTNLDGEPVVRSVLPGQEVVVPGGLAAPPRRRCWRCSSRSYARCDGADGRAAPSPARGAAVRPGAAGPAPRTAP